MSFITGQMDMSFTALPHALCNLCSCVQGQCFCDSRGSSTDNRCTWI